MVNKKKHDTNILNLRTDLKSARKITKEKPYFKTCIFFQKLTYKSCTVSSMINDKNKWDGKW